MDPLLSGYPGLQNRPRPTSPGTRAPEARPSPVLPLPVLVSRPLLAKPQDRQLRRLPQGLACQGELGGGREACWGSEASVPGPELSDRWLTLPGETN